MPLPAPSRRVVAYAAAALLLVGVIVWLVLPRGDETSTGVGADGAAGAREMRNLQVGDCLTIRPRPDKGRGATGGMNIWHEEVACNTPGVTTYSVGLIARGPLTCPNPNYEEYWEVDDRDKQQPRRWTACLMPNLSVGQCYEPDSQTRAFTTAPCGSNSLFKVEAMYDVDDGGRCTGVAEAFRFPKPARTYCVSSLT